MFVYEEYEVVSNCRVPAIKPSPRDALAGRCAPPPISMKERADAAEKAVMEWTKAYCVMALERDELRAEVDSMPELPEMFDTWEELILDHQGMAEERNEAWANESRLKAEVADLKERVDGLEDECHDNLDDLEAAETSEAAWEELCNRYKRQALSALDDNLQDVDDPVYALALMYHGVQSLIAQVLDMAVIEWDEANSRADSLVEELELVAKTFRATEEREERKRSAA